MTVKIGVAGLWRRHRWFWILGIFVVVLVAVRAALPSVVKHYANAALIGLKSYDGRVADVDLALWRGGYSLQGVRIVKTGSRQSTPFFDGEQIDFSIEWRSLLRGSFVAEGVFTRPTVNLVRAEDESQSQLGKEVNWPDELEKAFPFRFNTVKVFDGTVTFRAPGIRTKDALKATRVYGEISNLTNVVETGRETFALFQATAAVLDSGSAKLEGSANPLARKPTFDLNLTVKNVQLPEVNPWLRQYIKADAESGDFEIYTELAAAEGRFTGYAKPIMRDVDIYSSNENKDNPLRHLWEGIVDFAAEIVEDEETDQVAARIPFSGTVKDPHAGIFETVVSVLRNAFVSAFARSLEDSITIRDAKEKLRKISATDSRQGGDDRNAAEVAEREESIALCRVLFPNGFFRILNIRTIESGRLSQPDAALDVPAETTGAASTYELCA